jgi:hypothetical protein
MTKTKGFKNPKNQSQDQTKGIIRNQKKQKTKNKGDFLNQELGKIDSHFMNNDLWVDYSYPPLYNTIKQKRKQNNNKYIKG